MKIFRLFLLFCCGFGLLALQGCSDPLPVNAISGMNDLQYGQSEFEALIRGDAGAEAGLDFEILTINGEDVGALYNALTPDVDKADFQRKFVQEFSKGFTSRGGTPEGFTNWRVESNEPLKSVILTDGPTGIVTALTVTQKDGKQIISDITSRG